MLRNTFLKTLLDQRKAAIWWSLGLVGLSFYAMFLYPIIQESAGLTEFLDQLPEALTALAGGVLDYSTVQGFLSAQMFSFIAPIIILAFTITRGSYAIAGEEEKGTLEILLANPVPRWRIVAEKSASMVVGAVGLGMVLWVGLQIAALAFGVETSPGLLAQGITAIVLLGICGGMISLAVGAATGRRAFSVAAAVTVLIVGFLVSSFYELVEALAPLRYISLFYYYDDTVPVVNGLSAGHAMVLVGVSLAMFTMAVVTFERRDLRG